jgi:hypothetical protein
VAASDRRLDSPAGPKGQRNCHRMRTSSSRHLKNWKPTPVSDFARHPYMLMDLGQRDEPSRKLSYSGRENGNHTDDTGRFSNNSESFNPRSRKRNVGRRR